MEFGDEKSFKCDDADEFRCIWLDLEKKEVFLSRCQHSRNEIILWSAFCGHRKTKLVEINCRLNEQEYIEMLEEELLPCADDQLHFNRVFQQGNFVACT